MLNSLGLLKQRRFLPLFATQYLGAFNDNLFKTSMVLFATYQVFHDPKGEANFNALATGIGILPFFLFSALAGQFADSHDKAKLIRLIKTAEIGIMVLGASGLVLARAGYSTTGLAVMLGAVLLLGVHSTFFGPIKYAILPQHLGREDVLGGTGLVEAGTYLAILTGTIAAGFVPIDYAAIAVLAVAVIGWFTARQVLPAPPGGPPIEVNYNPFTSSWRVISATLHIPRLFLAICAISFFWTIGAVLIVVFPPLVKHVLTANELVATFAIAIFSVGVAIGSVVINSMLKGRISARYAPASVIAMGLFVCLFALLVDAWVPAPRGTLYDLAAFAAQPLGVPIGLALLAIAITGGMFVVPLYAFLTTTVEANQTARTVAANNVVNSGAMVVGTVAVIAMSSAGASSVNLLFLVAAMCIISAWIAHRLHMACAEAGTNC